ncbi:putative bifunctional diguanylate cyclase/phosphodiesterase [Granulicella rosea]|nr:EAL domain-containing protein [Granulicella rosea]
MRQFITRNQTLLLRLACAAGGLMIFARLLFDGWRDGGLFGGPVNPRVHRTEEMLAWMAYLALALALAVFLYRNRKLLPSNWVVGAFGVALVAEILGHMARSRSFGEVPLVVVNLLQIFGAAAAALTALGLPVYFRGIQRLARLASKRAASEARLAATTESSLDAIFMFESVRDATGELLDFRFTFINRNAETMIGQPRERLLGARLGELFPNVYQDGRMAQLRSVVETGRPLVVETTASTLRSKGVPAFCRIHAVKLEDGVAVSAANLSELKQANQEMKRALAFNKAIVSSSPFSIIVADLDGTITAVNPAAARMLWYGAEELIGNNIALLHDQQEIARRARTLSQELMRPVSANSDVFRQKALLGLTDENEWSYIRKDGSRLLVQLIVSAVEDETGAVIGLMGIAHDLSERKQLSDSIYHRAHHDPLTGLPSRSLLRDRMEVAIERGKRFQSLFSVLMIDLDNFKRVNDSLGHQAGDAILVEVANRLRSCLRKVDTIARYGGDEFVVLLTELRSRSHAETVGRKIIAALAAPIVVGNHEIAVTASIGLSMFPDSIEPDELLRHADVAMYRSKALGRNSLAVFTPGLGRELMDKLKLESALRTALDRDEFYLVYQPQVSLKTGQLTGVEALIRWKSPALGLVMPGDFIPVAEETGLIVSIGEWALRTACDQIAQLQLDLRRRLNVAVNLSPRQVHQKDFQTMIESALLESGLPANSLEVELTEHLLMRDSEESLEIIERVQALGVKVAIDDFGTGFSNMSYITRFRIDRLKIDQSFVSRCVDDQNSLAVTTAIIALAHSLRIDVVAEGVETPAQAAVLRDLRCDFAQGYLYARPLSLEGLRAMASETTKQSVLESI